MAKSKKSKESKIEKSYWRLNTATGIIAVIWTLLIAATALTWMGRHFIHYPQFEGNKGALIGSCFGICIGALLVLSMGIYECYYAFAEGICEYSSIALGIWFIIITGVIPGVLYFVCRGVDSKVDHSIPANYANYGGTTTNTGGTRSGGGTKKIDKPVTKSGKKDPRKYFVEDEDDVGLVPVIKKVKFEDLDAAVDEDE